MIPARIRETYKYIKVLLSYKIKTRQIAKLRHINVADTDSTINYLLNTSSSMSRYGDGEFQLVWQYLTGKDYLDRDTFQKYDEKLANRLYEILSSNVYDNSNHIVCVPYIFFVKQINKSLKSKTFVLNFLAKHCNILYNSLNICRNYYDSNITRFYLSEKNKAKSKERIAKIRQLWDNRDICFIEGDKSRLGVGNDLFDNAKSITRILCPSESAFDCYDEIVQAAKEQPAGTLFLLALGMTATVLAYDLAKAGYRALDLGHIDIEYEWMLMGATTKVAIPHKYTNEASGGKHVQNVRDDRYLNQIVRRVGC